MYKQNFLIDKDGRLDYIVQKVVCHSIKRRDPKLLRKLHNCMLTIYIKVHGTYNKNKNIQNLYQFI